MVKSYLRYCFATDFGVVTSPESNVVFDHSGTIAITGANEFLSLWNPRTGEIVSKLSPATCQYLNDENHSTSFSSPVTRICSHPVEKDVVAAGYSDGSVRCWNTSTGELLLTLGGHKSSVAYLEFSLDGHLLATGGCDSDIVIWDLVSQLGLFRLSGHRNAVTCLRFLYSPVKIEDDNNKHQPASQEASSEPRTEGDQQRKKKSKKRSRKDVEEIHSAVHPSPSSPYVEFFRTPCLLVSGSKDGTVKVWDLSTQWCIQTIFDSSGEVCSLAVNPTQVRWIIGRHQLFDYKIVVEQSQTGWCFCCAILPAYSC